MKMIVGIDLYNLMITDDVAMTFGGGRTDQHNIPHIIEMQRTTGTLSPGAHAGSYNGQDAYNDMLITNGILNSEDRRIQAIQSGEYPCTERLQKCDRPDYPNRGGGYGNE